MEVVVGTLGQGARFANATLKTLLDSLVGVGNQFENAELVLLKTCPATTPTPAWADVVEADYSGYARKTALTWQAATLEQGGAVMIQTLDPPPVFTQNGGAVENEIVAYAIVIGAGAAAVIQWVELLAEPILMTAENNSMVVIPRLVLSPDMASTEG